MILSFTLGNVIIRLELRTDMMIKDVNREKKDMRSVNGFTLIEMVGVIVIMGLILIVVFPTMSKMIHGNRDKKYEEYRDLIEAGARSYAVTRTDDLGSSKYSGCIRVTLDTLISGGYVQKLDEKDTNCKLGTNNITIRNNKGVVDVNFTLLCNGNAIGEKEKQKDDGAACNSVSIKEEINLKTKLSSLPAANRDESEKPVVYIKGGNNYIWYSGNLWRAVSYNSVTDVVKAVTVDSVTSIYYNHSGSSTYSGSDAETWLNNEFLTSLKDYQSFLTTSNWTMSSGNVGRARIGLIDTQEFAKIKDWYGGETSWLLTEGTSNKSYISKKDQTTAQVASNSIYGLRPAITFSSDVLVDRGSGTAADPYIIDSSYNAFGAIGDLLNTRYAGEYVNVGGSVYRIISTDGGKTKVIGTTSTDSGAKYAFSSAADGYHFDYAASNLHNGIMEKKYTNPLIVTGDFCTDTINATTVYQSSKCLDASRVNSSIRIGLPKIGEKYTTNIAGVGNYWTINPYKETEGGTTYTATINVIKPDGSVGTNVITSTAEAVAVFYLDSDTKISSGNGMSNNPYTLIK